MSDQIRVAVRVRPLIEREKNSNIKVSWKVNHPNEIYQIDNNGYPIHGTNFKFDRVFSYIESNSDVYDELCKDIVESVCCGFHGTIFAYGQTSSGKTHTMSGCSVEKGIISLAIDDIFNKIEMASDREYLMRVSYMEIYNEGITDLLHDGPGLALKIKANMGDVYVDGLEEVIVSSPEHVLELLEKGQAKRKVGETSMNEHSSRSHTIFRMIIESRSLDADVEGAIQVSHLNLVDLAGSEKAGQMGSTGQRLKEGVHINVSLFHLGVVIKSLSEGTIPGYRNSKLTRILQNSLGGNARTAIICNVTPTNEHTLSTLLFAKRAKTICNKPVVNEVLTDQAKLRDNQKKIREMERELELLRSGKSAVVEKELEEKDKKIEHLENMLKNLKGNVLSPKSPSILARKMRRETWGGHIKGNVDGGAQSIFGHSSQSLSSLPVDDLGISSMRLSSFRLSDLHERDEESLPLFADSSSIRSLSISSEKPKRKRVNFYIPSESPESREPISNELSPLPVDLIHDMALKLNAANEEIDKLKTLLEEKEATLNNLNNKLLQEMMTFSQVEEYVSAKCGGDIEDDKEMKIKVTILQREIERLTQRLKELTHPSEVSSLCLIDLNDSHHSPNLMKAEKHLSYRHVDACPEKSKESLSIEIEKLGFDLFALKAELSCKSDELNKIASENNEYKTEIERLKSSKVKVEAVDSTDQSLQTEVLDDSLRERDLENVTEIEQLKDRLSSLENQLCLKNSELSESSVENCKCKEEIARLKRSLTLLFEENDELKRVKTEADKSASLTNQELLDTNSKYLDIQQQLWDAVNARNSLDDEINELKTVNQKLAQDAKLAKDNWDEEVEIYQVKVSDLESQLLKLTEELNTRPFKPLQDGISIETTVLAEIATNTFREIQPESVESEIIPCQGVLPICDKCQLNEATISDLKNEINQLSIELNTAKNANNAALEKVQTLEKEFQKESTKAKDLEKKLESILMEKTDSDEAIKQYETLVAEQFNQIKLLSDKVGKLEEEKSNIHESSLKYQELVMELENNAEEMGKQLEHLKHEKAKSEAIIEQYETRMTKMRNEIKRFCDEVELMKSQKAVSDGKAEQIQKELERMSLMKKDAEKEIEKYQILVADLKGKESETRLKESDQERHLKEEIIQLKTDLQEEKLKFDEFFTDMMKEQEVECEIQQKQLDEIDALTAQIKELQNENNVMSEKLKLMNSEALGQPSNDVTLLKEKLDDVSAKLNSETSNRKEVEVKLLKQIKSYESLKNELKYSQERINSLKLQLRKAQNSLNESIMPNTTKVKTVVQETLPNSAPVKTNNDLVGAMGNIAAAQVFAAQQQVYQLQQTCKKLNDENNELRQKVLSLKKRLSQTNSSTSSISEPDTCSTISNPFTSTMSEKENKSDKPSLITDDDVISVQKVKPKSPVPTREFKASVPGGINPFVSHQYYDVKTPDSKISTPETPDDDFTFNFGKPYSNISESESSKRDDCKTQ